MREITKFPAPNKCTIPGLLQVLWEPEPPYRLIALTKSKVIVLSSTGIETEYTVYGADYMLFNKALKTLHVYINSMELVIINLRSHAIVIDNKVGNFGLDTTHVNLKIYAADTTIDNDEVIAAGYTDASRVYTQIVYRVNGKWGCRAITTNQGQIFGVSFSPDKRYIAVTYADHYEVFSSSTGSIQYVENTPALCHLWTETPQNFMFNANKAINSIYFNGYSSTGNKETEITSSSPLYMTFDPNYKYLTTSESVQPGIQIIAWKEKEVISRTDLPHFAGPPQWHPKERKLAAAVGSVIYVWSP